MSDPAEDPWLSLARSLPGLTRLIVSSHVWLGGQATRAPLDRFKRWHTLAVQTECLDAVELGVLVAIRDHFRQHGRCLSGRYPGP
jgi:hypothetical protein